MTAFNDLARQDPVTARTRPAAPRHRKAGMPAIGPRHARTSLSADIRRSYRQAIWDGIRIAFGADIPPVDYSPAAQLERLIRRAS